MPAPARVLQTKEHIYEIKELNEFIDLTHNLQAADTLFVFDLDNTVLEYTHTLGSDQWVEAEFAKQNTEDHNEADILFQNIKTEYIKFATIAEVSLVEPGVKAFIKHLQDNNFPTLALTARGDYLQDVTFRHLKDIELSFDNGKFKNQDFKLDTIQGDECPRLCQGIVQCSGKHKRLNINPKRVVFIDDKLKNINKVAESLRDSGIEFHGFRYGFLDKKVAKMNAAIAEQQLAMLGRIPTDRESRAILVDRSKDKLIVSKTAHHSKTFGQKVIRLSGSKQSVEQKLLKIFPDLKPNLRPKNKFKSFEHADDKVLCFQYAVPESMYRKLYPELRDQGLVTIDPKWEKKSAAKI